MCDHYKRFLEICNEVYYVVIMINKYFKWKCIANVPIHVYIITIHV
jgi:hypothetical protein